MGRGKGRGTGVPIFFKCGVCRNKRARWSLTGKRRPLYGRAAFNCPPRSMLYQVQYLCNACGHVGWSRHSDCERRAT